MDKNGFLRKHSDTPFKPSGQDEFGVYMVVENCIIHVRNDDVAIAENLPLKQIWPLVSRVQSI